MMKWIKAVQSMVVFFRCIFAFFYSNLAMRKCQMFAMASVLSDAPRTKEKRILRNKPSSFQQQKGNWNLSLSLSQGCGTLKMPAIASRFCSVDVRFSGPRRRQLKAKSEEMEPDSASSGSRPSDRSIFFVFFRPEETKEKRQVRWIGFWPCSTRFCFSVSLTFLFLFF